MRDRVSLLLLATLFLAAPIFCQETTKFVCTEIEKAPEAGIDIGKLREAYIPAFSNGPGVCAMPDQGEEVRQAWLDLTKAIVDHFKKEADCDLVGQRFFCIFFFGKDGRIEYVVHRCSHPSMSEAFCQFVADFAREYRFPVKSELPFSQCGSLQIHPGM